MIQRTQSIYLFLVFVVSVILIFFPLTSFDYEGTIFQMNIMMFSGVDHLDFELPNIMIIGILTALLGIMSLFTIFQFKNRKLQIKLNMINLLINFGLLGAIFYYSDSVAKMLEIEPDYDIAAYFPIASVLLLILANRNIRADEKLVRQSERLR